MPFEGRVTCLEETMSKFIHESSKIQKENEALIRNIKKGYDMEFKNHTASIKRLEIQVGKLAELVKCKMIG